MLPDGRLALAIEGRIKQGELPSRRGAACHDPILAAVKMKILALISDIVKCRHSRTNMEVHVCQKAVVRNVESNPHRPRITVANLKVHIADSGIKGARIGVYHARRRRNSSGKGNWR